MAQLRMWNIVLFGHMKKQPKWVFLYPTDSAGTHHSENKYYKDTTPPQLLIQHHCSIISKSSYGSCNPTNPLGNRQFLKLLYLSHTLQLMSTSCLLPLNTDVIQQQFSISERITTARDFVCSQAYLSILLTLLPL